MASAKEVLEVADSNLNGDELVRVKAARKDGETMIFVQADERITNLLHDGRQRTSSNWVKPNGENLEFHKKSGYDDVVRSVLEEYLDGYGGDIGDNGKGNIAFLRTVGVEDGVYIDVNRPTTEEHIRQVVKDIKSAVDDLRNAFLKDVAVIGEIREVDIDNTVETG